MAQKKSMTQAPEGFKSKTINTQTVNDSKPDGDYDVELEVADLKQNNAQTGWLVSVRLRVDQDAERYANACFFENCNVDHPNPEAERIGLETLGKIANAGGYRDELVLPDDLPKLIGLKLRLVKRTGRRGQELHFFQSRDAKRMAMQAPEKEAPKSFKEIADEDNVQI